MKRHDPLYCMLFSVLILHITARFYTQCAVGYMKCCYFLPFIIAALREGKATIHSLFFSFFFLFLIYTAWMASFHETLPTCGGTTFSGWLCVIVAMKGWFVTHDIWLIATLEWRLTCTPPETAGPALWLSYPEDQLKASGLLVFSSLRDQFIFMLFTLMVRLLLWYHFTLCRWH